MSICRETMVTPTHSAPPALRRMLAGTTALTTTAVCGWLLTTDPAWADLQTGGTVVEGSAQITYGADSVTIQQGSDRVIIEWDTFDVGEGNAVNFLQQDFMVALNRVLNGGPSEILGSLTAGGTVIISNPAGVVFGPNASVDVQSIVATSLNRLLHRRGGRPRRAAAGGRWRDRRREPGPGQSRRSGTGGRPRQPAGPGRGHLCGDLFRRLLERRYGVPVGAGLRQRREPHPSCDRRLDARRADRKEDAPLSPQGPVTEPEERRSRATLENLRRLR